MRSGLIHTMVVVSVCSGAGYGFYYLDKEVVGPLDAPRQPIRSAAVEGGGGGAGGSTHKVVIGTSPPATAEAPTPVWRDETALYRGERVVGAGDPAAAAPPSPAQLAAKAVFVKSADATSPNKYIPRSYSTTAPRPRSYSTAASRPAPSGPRTSGTSYGRYSLNNLPQRSAGYSRSTAVAGSKNPFATGLSKMHFKKPRFPFSFTKKRMKSGSRIRR